jgi:2,4-dienoyl-CoA reductase-like NADH-dependent reductase (Old Yellow Enzyme family)
LQKFKYDKDSLMTYIKDFNLDLGYQDDISILKEEVDLGDGYISPNRMAIHPLEGCDGHTDGSPSEFSLRRYKRFARGGAGLVWFEAIAICEESRANPRQLYITEQNKEVFKTFVDEIRKTRSEVSSKKQILIAQLTHSGRYSKPNGAASPICAYDNVELRESSGLPEDAFTYAADEYLDSLPDMFAKTALLLKEAGFDGVDIKACHGYLLGELLSAYEREGKYGGSFENRVKLLMTSFKKVKEACGDNFILTVRLNLYDSYLKTENNPGWGGNVDKMDLTEPIKLIGMLKDMGMKVINITMGNPYHNPHINRPYNAGGYTPPEHPLVGLGRLIEGSAKVKQEYPDMIVVGTGYSWFRQCAPHVAANEIANNKTDIMGMGRVALAYPDFANDIINHNRMFSDKICLTCSLCTKIMRAGRFAGCPVRDQEVYLPILREVRKYG